MADGFSIHYDPLDGRWFVMAGQYVEAGPFDSEQDAADYIEAWLDD